MTKQQLAAKIWTAANKLRSNIEAYEYKNYILGLIFYKYLCEKELAHLREDGYSEEAIKNVDADKIKPDEKDGIMKITGYIISYKHLFSTWVQDSNFRIDHVDEALRSFNNNIRPEIEHLYRGVFDTLASGIYKLGGNMETRTRTMIHLLDVVKDIPMGGENDYDVLGFIYEYLLKNFAANAGKKAGEFYTPHEVSVVMSEIIAFHLKDLKEIGIYDPTSGSGSLLINIGESVKKHSNKNVNVLSIMPKKKCKILTT